MKPEGFQNPYNKTHLRLAGLHTQYNSESVALKRTESKKISESASVGHKTIQM